jgi:hypothetical protein
MYTGKPGGRCPSDGCSGVITHEISADGLGTYLKCADCASKAREKGWRVKEVGRTPPEGDDNG